MEAIPTERIRNVALVGHGGVGKTTLAEAMAFEAGATSRLGRVEDGCIEVGGGDRVHGVRQRQGTSLCQGLLGRPRDSALR